MSSAIPTTRSDDKGSELFEIQQYAKIVQFCETVFSGRHPTVRPVLENGSKLPGDAEFNARIELQLQRKKLEQRLREDVESRRPNKPAQFERPPNFDLSDILSKAMALTGSDHPSLTGANEPTTDDSTFYSSVFETPDSNLTSIVRNKSTELQAPPPLPGERDDEQSLDTAGSSSGNGHDDRRLPVQPAVAYGTAQGHANTAAPYVVPGLNSYSSQPARDAQGQIARDRDAYMDMHPPSPLLRNAATHQIPVYPPAAPNASLYGAPAQVAALRQRRASAASTNSSSDGPADLTGKGRKSKKSKSKRKARVPASQGEPVPFIKPEPRSPSPFAGPSSIRPTKRQRHSQGNTTGPDAADESGYASASQARHNEQPMQRVPSGYDPTRPLLAPELRYMQEPGDRRWASRDDPPNVPVRYMESDPHGPRMVTYLPPDSQYRNQPQYHSGPPEAVRYDVPPGATYYYETAPTRIYVHPSGREYIKPPRPAVRQSVAPRSHSGYYETVPPTTASQQIRHGYDDNSPYDRPPSPFASHRRIITEPEPVAREQPGRYGEYTGHAGAHRERFVEVVPQHRQYADATETYIRRATSMMPMDGQLAGSYERVYRPGPEAAPEQRDGQRIAGQHDVRPSYIPAYEAAGPAEQPVFERFSVAPNTRRYDEPVYVDHRRDDGRPVYTDSYGREVHR